MALAAVNLVLKTGLINTADKRTAPAQHARAVVEILAKSYCRRG